MPDQTQQQFKREVACIVNIKELVTGEYVKEEGWTPNYILTGTGKRVSRVNILGVVVPSTPNEANYSSILVDDGSDVISVRDFEESSTLNKFKSGDVVQVIGRPRQYGQEKYIVPESVKAVKNLKWLELRKLELRKIELGEMRELTPKIINEEVISDSEDAVNDVYDLVLTTIETNDSGDGVDTEKIVKTLKDSDIEPVIGDLLKKGEIFEVRPGRLKRL